jgi:nicotinamide-nucleotide amidase
MKAEIITIGDEILIGQIVDTNAVFMAEVLTKSGIAVHWKSTIPDSVDAIISALDMGLDRSDLLIFSGGLGPTRDDKTKQTLTDYFEDELVLNQEVLDHIEEIFRKYITTPISDMNRSQAQLPSKAEVLFNVNGTAPGMWFQTGKKAVVSLPGVPYEMKHLMREKVIPRVQERFELPAIEHRTLITYGMGESAIAERIEDFELGLPDDIKLAYLPSLGRVRLRLSATGNDKQTLVDYVAGYVKTLRSLVSDIYYGEEQEGGIEAGIAHQFKEKKQTLAVAESFTGGQIARQLVALPGASDYFRGGIVAYATEIKETVLEVPQALVQTHSVVSEAVALAMAQNARKRMGSDFAIATTGNAGPDKGDSPEEVGTVFIAIATPDKSFAQSFQMGANRERITQKSVNKALEMIYQEILNF